MAYERQRRLQSARGSGARYRLYQATSAQAVARTKCSHEYMPCDPSGLKITITQVDKPGDERDRPS